MNNKINIIIENGFEDDYAELEEILNNNSFQTEKKNKLNHDEMGFNISALIVLLPTIYPYIVEFRKILCSYISYMKTKRPEFKLTLENNGKKLNIEAKNMSVPNVDEFKSFFEIQ